MSLLCSFKLCATTAFIETEIYICHMWIILIFLQKLQYLLCSFMFVLNILGAFYDWGMCSLLFHKNARNYLC